MARVTRNPFTGRTARTSEDGAQVESTRKAGAGLPLALYIVKYFACAIVLIAAVWVLSFAALSASMNAGAVYPANWGAANAERTAADLQARGSFDARSVPTAYRYALFGENGDLLETDMEGAMLEHARDLGAGGAATTETEVSGSAGATYASFGLPDGTSCVLGSAYLPQFVSPELRDALPNPQNLMLAAGAAGSLVAVALVAWRAGRSIARKMAPLTDAAERISREDLDFSVETGGVREVNEVLAAMDRMRASLKESLEARWDAERRQRDQVAALAHDLKTPLTVVRANAEYVCEEASALAEPGSALDRAALRDLADAAADAAAGSERLDAYVRLLIETSRGPSLSGGTPAAVGAGELVAAVEAEAGPLARAAGVGLEVSVEDGVLPLHADAPLDGLARAVVNVVSNAVEHAAARVLVAVRRAGGFLEFEVSDDGEGFSPEALERGCERFFRGDSSRRAGHYGLGLYSASETLRSCGGEIELSNGAGEKGSLPGARVIIRVPARA